MPGSAYHFQRQDGTPFWWQGETQWILFGNLPPENLTRATALNFLDRRAAQGFNVIHAALDAPYGGPAVDGRGTPKPDYFREADLRIAHANARGITVGLALAWGTRWKAYPSDAARLRFARYVAARYGAYNVYFVVANEWRDGLSASQVRAIGSELRQSDPHARLVANHSFGPSKADGPVGNEGSVEQFAGQPWMGFGDYQQLYDQLHERILRARDHDKPVVNAEYGYFLRDQDGDGHVDKNNSFTLDHVRFASWDIAMAGGYFMTGFATTYYGGIRDEGPFDPQASANRPWEAQVQHIRRLFDGTGWLDWWKLEPADGLVSTSQGRSDDEIVTNPDGAFFAPPPRTHWALAEVGRQYVAYLRGNAGAHQLALGVSTSGTYRVLRYDPRGGAYAELGTYTGRGPVTLDPPDASDWVYVLLKR
ncbi:MAG: DUF4038 domain-containing protein [Gemmatimonadetes bacterium]|nr:DUF4038 domain-containing protein [Gemmatimonadota bacterium]